MDGGRENYTEVDTSGSFLDKVGLDVHELIDSFGHQFASMNEWVPLYRKHYCNGVYRNAEFDRVLRDGGGRHGFDLVIMEPSLSDCASYLAAALRLPIIYVLPSPMITFLERTFTGHQSNPSCVAHLHGRSIGPMTFRQRFVNSLQLFYGLFVTACQELVQQTIDPQLYDQCPRVHPSVIFQNSHYVSEVARPVTPNLIDVGGIHLTPAKPIPKVRNLTLF